MEHEDGHDVDRVTLYEEVWAEPVSLVAIRYGLSDVGLAKICRSLAIPLPGRGYWSKVKAGKVMKKAALPELPRGHQPIARLTKLLPDAVRTRAEAREEAAKIRRESVGCDVHFPFSPHPLVLAASKRLRQTTGWPKDTRLRHSPAEVLDIAVTPAALDRALLITDTLLQQLGKHGLTACIDAGKPATMLKEAKTGVEMRFALSEHVKRTVHELTPTEENARRRYFDRLRKGLSADYPEIPQYDYHPTGMLTIAAGHWPSRTWKDTAKTALEKRLGEILAGILILAKEAHTRELEANRKAEERRHAIERYEYLVKRREAEAERFKLLESQATDWERAERLRRFADATERLEFSEGLLRKDIKEWLVWVRAKADCLDPLVDVSDVILSAPLPQKPGYW